MSEILIRKPTKRDIKWAIWREFELMGEVDPVFRPGFMSFFRRLIWRYVGLPSLYQRAEGFFSEIDGKNAGFTFSYIRPIMMRIDSFMVDPFFRKMGVGTKLLEAINDFAVDYEIRYLVSAIPRENPEGFVYAKKMGFSPYRNLLLTMDDTSGFLGGGSEVEVEKLSLSDAKGEYHKWFNVELESGDKWAFDLIESEFAELGFNQVGKHFSCQIDGSGKGYLRFHENAGKATVYLSCDQDYWTDKIQLEWIRAALYETGKTPESINIMFGSGGHHDAARNLFLSEEFVEETRQRYLVVKDLGPIKTNEEDVIDIPEE